MLEESMLQEQLQRVGFFCVEQQIMKIPASFDQEIYWGELSILIWSFPEGCTDTDASGELDFGFRVSLPDGPGGCALSLSAGCSHGVFPAPAEGAATLTLSADEEVGRGDATKDEKQISLFFCLLSVP